MKKIREGERAVFALWFVLLLRVSAFCGYKPSLYSVNSFLHVCLGLSQSSTEERERHLKQEYGCKVTRIGRDNNLECRGVSLGEGAVFLFSLSYEVD